MILTAIIATITAYIVKGMSGFANTLVFSSIMSFTANNINITPTELIIGYPSNIFIAYRNRKSLSLKIWMPLSLLVIAGIIPGAFFLKNAGSAALKVIMGFAIIGIAFEMFFRERQKVKSKSSKLILAIIGVFSGILCGLFGIGAFLAAYINRTTYNQNEFKGNLCVVFFIENTFRIILYTFTGIINLTIFKAALSLIPFMIIGLAVGTFLSKQASDKLIKKLVIILLFFSGLSIVLTNISNMF